jgi:hypothetical protein
MALSASTSGCPEGVSRFAQLVVSKRQIRRNGLQLSIRIACPTRCIRFPWRFGQLNSTAAEVNVFASLGRICRLERAFVQPILDKFALAPSFHDPSFVENDQMVRDGRRFQIESRSNLTDVLGPPSEHIDDPESMWVADYSK